MRVPLGVPFEMRSYTACSTISISPCDEDRKLAKLLRAIPRELDTMRYAGDNAGAAALAAAAAATASRGAACRPHWR